MRVSAIVSYIIQLFNINHATLILNKKVIWNRLSHIIDGLRIVVLVLAQKG